MAFASISAAVAAAMQPDVFASTTRVLVGPVSADEDTLEVSAALVDTYAALVQSQTVLEAATTRSARPAFISATGNAATRMVDIHVESADPTNSRMLGNALAAELVRIAPLAPSPAHLTVVNPASPPVRLGIDVRLAVLGSLLAAALACAGLVLVIEEARPRMLAPGRLSRAAQAPVLAFRPQLRAGRPEPSSRELQMLGIAVVAQGPLNRLVIVGTTEASATSETAQGLAEVLDAQGMRVAVMAARGGPYGSASAALAELEELQGSADVVVVDAGAIGGPVDVPALAAAAEGTVVLAQHHDTMDQQLGIQDLRSVGANVLAVLVEVPFRRCRSVKRVVA